MRYDRARVSLDRHAAYIVSTYLAGAVVLERRFVLGRVFVNADSMGTMAPIRTDRRAQFFLLCIRAYSLRACC